MPPLRLSLAIAVTGALLLTACGSTEDVASPQTKTSAEASTAPVEVTDARGKVITLDAPAKRVVALEWNVVEHAVSLGVMPVGVSDVKGYGNWAKSAPLDDTAEDVGVRGEPSVETIAGLEPDLILATKDLPDKAIAQLEKLAPVVVAASSDAKDNLGTMQSDLEMVAAATGTEDKAEALMADLTTKLDEGKAALADGGPGRRQLLHDRRLARRGQGLDPAVRQGIPALGRDRASWVSSTAGRRRATRCTGCRRPTSRA